MNSLSPDLLDAITEGTEALPRVCREFKRWSSLPVGSQAFKDAEKRLISQLKSAKDRVPSLQKVIYEFHLPSTDPTYKKWKEAIEKAGRELSDPVVVSGQME